MEYIVISREVFDTMLSLAIDSLSYESYDLARKIKALNTCKIKVNELSRLKYIKGKVDCDLNMYMTIKTDSVGKEISISKGGDCK